MPSAIHLRILGQVAALGVHGINSLVMLLAMQDQELMKDQEIKDMTDLQSCYLTVWNVLFQMLYFSVALVCDGATLINMDHLLSKSIKKFRFTLLAVFVVPTTMLVFEIFWPLFIYDRNLIFPAFIDKIFSFKSNFVMHFMILPFALWELLNLPRPVPTSHSGYVRILFPYYLAYYLLILITFKQCGRFPYPFLNMVYGTIYFPLLIVMGILLHLFNYFIQWRIKREDLSDGELSPGKKLQ